MVRKPILLHLKFEELLLNVFTRPLHRELAGYLVTLNQEQSVEIQQVMEGNFAYNLKLEDFANLCKMSLSSFKRTFGKVYSKGSVTAVDLSEGMLQIAREKAKVEEIDNFYTQVADASALPFRGATFDAVSCRLGFMFFPDMHLAASEMIRVLKPGGKLAVTVWGAPADNLWVTALMGPIKKHIDLPVPPADAPGMFRCAQPGFMTSLFKEAGLPGGVETSIKGTMHCSSTDEYWSFMNDVVPPVVAVFKSSDEETVEKIKNDVYQLLEDKLPGREKKSLSGPRC